MVRSSVAAWSRPLGCRRLCLYLPIHGINTTLLPFVEREFIVFILTGLLLVLGRFNSRYTILSQVRRFLVFLVGSFCKNSLQNLKVFPWLDSYWIPFTIDSIIAGLYWTFVNLKVCPIDSIIVKLNNCWTLLSFSELENLSYWLYYCWIQYLLNLKIFQDWLLLNSKLLDFTEL